MEHHVQSVDDALIGGLSYKLKAGASYVQDRRSVTFFASGGNQYSPSGVKVCKFNIVADQWLDPSTFRVMFTINNLNYGTNLLKSFSRYTGIRRFCFEGLVLLLVVKLLKTSMMLIVFHSCLQP